MYTTKPIANPKLWETWVTARPEANFLQSYTYGLVSRDVGKPVFWDGFYDGKVLKGVGMAAVEDARRGRYLAVPGGPILDWTDDSLVAVWLHRMKELATENQCGFVRVRPQLTDTPEHRQLFHDFGLRLSPMHLTAETTLQLDLTQDLDSIKKQMRKNTRYEVNRAEKLGITVTASTNPEDVKAFYELQTQTAKRQAFVPFSLKTLQAEFSRFVEQDQSVLYTARHEGNTLAQAMIIHYPPESSYHFAASSPEGRKLPGAYAIQWQAFQDAQIRGIPRYNFWGIVGKNETDHRFYGVSVFKRGFGGEEVNYIPAHDLVIDQLRYLPTYWFEKVRKRLRRL